jgi:hypothetical protein
MTASFPATALATPERMWFATARLGYSPTPRPPGDISASARWFRDGKLYLSPWSGKQHEFDERLREAQPGDPVFAYEPGVGVVAVGWVSNPKELTRSGPNEIFPLDGSIVLALSVDWDTSVTRTRRQVWEVSNLGASNFKSCGPGTRFYPMAIEMLQEVHNRYQADPIAAEVAAVKRIRTSAAYNAKSVSQLVEARIGQGRFRAAVLAREPACRLTGITQRACLVASHIKPWGRCVGAEHLDGANGLMLAPHVDHLFDTGLISFEDDGRLMLAPELDRSVLAAWRIDERQNVGQFAPDQARYLAFHRAHVFGRPRLRRQRNLVGDVPPHELATVTGTAE